MEKEISLLEALTGVDFVLKHLDDRKIRIKNNPGEIIKPDDIKTVESHGMPYHKKVYMSGNLFIHFKIKFPASMETKSIGLIQEALGSGQKTQPTKTASGKNQKAKEESKDEGIAEEVFMK